MSFPKTTILVTVPHATDDASKARSAHTGDFAAPAAAAALAGLLRAQFDSVAVLSGGVARTRCDLNRESCLRGDHDFSRRLQAALAQPALFGVIDVHSYPGDYRWTRSQRRAPHAVLLYEGSSQPPRFVRELRDAMQRAAPTARIVALRGKPGVNAIIVRAKRAGKLRSVLLEINEASWGSSERALLAAALGGIASHLAALRGVANALK